MANLDGWIWTGLSLCGWIWTGLDGFEFMWMDGFEVMWMDLDGYGRIFTDYGCFGLMWMDPAMGIVGGFLVARWSWGLLRGTSRVLVDRQAQDSVLEKIRQAIADDSIRILDLHVWEIGPGYRAAIVSVASNAAVSPSEIKKKIPEDLGITHATVEIHQGRADSSAAEDGR